MTPTTDTSALREAVATLLSEHLPLVCGRNCERECTEKDERTAFLDAADAILALTSAERDALAERVEERDFLLAILMATFGGPHGWFETRRLWHSAVQDNYENAYVEQTVADEWRRRASDAETRAREAEAKVQALTDLLAEAIANYDDGRTSVDLEADWVERVRALLRPTPSEQGGEHGS